MAVNLALWSMTLLPGDKYPLYIQNDFTITNVALPEDLADENGRSVVKVTYHPINPALLADPESDSEIDSEDFDDSDLEGLKDEFELDEEEGFKEVAKKAKVNGAGPNEESEEDEEEEEDEEDEDEDDDFSDDEPEVTNVICSLTAGKTEQAQVNLTFTEGDAVMFEVTGKNAVHLMGNYIRQPEPHSHDSEDDSEFDSDEDDYDMYSDSDMLEGEDEDMEEAPIGKITEIPAATKAVKADKAEKKADVAAAVTDKKRKAEQVESPAKPATAAANGEQLSKKQKKLAAAQEANEAAKKEAKKEKELPKKAETSKKRTLPSGLVIEDIKSGDGAGAKRGKRLGMRYIGKLTNGKQFDANTSGKPFSFVLGRGEVIKGWDEGLEGMKVGGERKLSIPPQLAYGNQKLPGIPKGSTLNFEVKLVSIN